MYVVIGLAAVVVLLAALGGSIMRHHRLAVERRHRRMAFDLALFLTGVGLVLFVRWRFGMTGLWLAVALMAMVLIGRVVHRARADA